MKNNKSILTAPETSDMARLYQTFLEFSPTTILTEADFYDFMTTPSLLRSQFLAQVGYRLEVADGIIRQTY